MTHEGYQGGKEAAAKSILENYVKDWKIFIDTCSLLHSAADSFWMNIIPFLHQYHNKLIIPLRSVEELQKHAANSEKPELAQKAQHCLKILPQLINQGFVEMRGEPSDSFADNVFQVVFTKFRMTHKLLLITQDNNLAKDITALNMSKSVSANPIHVKRMNKYGFLSNFIWNTKTDTAAPQNKTNHADSLDADQMFQLKNTVTPLKDAPLPVRYIPSEHETIYTFYGTIRLETKIAAGGEGIIYTTNTPYVAKIYKKENNTTRKYEKTKLMLSKGIKYDGICYPVAALYNAEKEFIGYLMPKAQGKELQKSIFIKPLF